MMAPRGILAWPLTTTLIAVMVVGSLVLVGGTANAADSCGYPSGTGRTATVFNESEVLLTFRIDTAKGTIQAFYNDEHALTLGENLNGFSITPFVAAYPKPNTTTKLADDASPVSIGDPNAADPQARPIYPALFLTDITSGPSTSGDWQQQSNHSTAKPPDFVAGTWKSFTPGASISDPAKNNWWLGPNADAVPLINGALPKDEGFGAEVRWNISNLPGLIPGHSYRAQFMVHDGDQNKSGGDVGEAWFNFGLPLAKVSTQASSASIAIGSSLTDDATVTVSGGANPPAPTGIVSFFVCNASSCATTGTAFNTKPLSGAVKSGNDYTVTSASFTPNAAGTWCFAASWPGDTNYTAGPYRDNGANECFTVTPRQPTIPTSQTACPLPLGSTIKDTATLANTAPKPNGDPAGGTNTVKAYGPQADPSNPVCTGTAVYTSAAYAVS